MEPGTIFGIALLILISIGATWARHQEKRLWNNGICEVSGMPWIHFDNDSQGGRMYHDGCGNFCDISYYVDIIRPIPITRQ